MHEIRQDINEYINTLTSPDREYVTSFLQNIASGKIFFSSKPDETESGRRLYNLDVCQCFSCKKFSVWRYGILLYPEILPNIIPNNDLSDDIRRDFVEATEILNKSPRGSAALLRLCVQKLCKELGEKGKNINDDIASLVRKGLDVRIQQALDVVRVIGNDAVHPGQIDLKDSSDTATKLFSLVNLIADAMISQPKAVNELFQSLPESKRAEITRRDT